MIDGDQRNARAICSSGSGNRTDEGARALCSTASASAAGRSILICPSRSLNLTSGRHAEHRSFRAQLGQPSDRRVHALRQRVRGLLARRTSTCRHCIEFTKSRNPGAWSNSKTLPPTLAIRLAWVLPVRAGHEVGAPRAGPAEAATSPASMRSPKISPSPRACISSWRSR